METSLYEITFKDGRIYRVFCANRKQNKDMPKSVLGLRNTHRDTSLV